MNRQTVTERIKRLEAELEQGKAFLYRCDGAIASLREILAELPPDPEPTPDPD